MKTSIALALATLLSSSLAAYAQTEQPTTPYHHNHVHHVQGPHHTVHHHFVAPNPAEAPAATTAAPQAAPFGLALPHIAPYPDNEGDEDGLSRDPDDCMKGCIGGNAQ